MNENLRIRNTNKVDGQTNHNHDVHTLNIEADTPSDPDDSHSHHAKSNNFTVLASVICPTVLGLPKVSKRQQRRIISPKNIRHVRVLLLALAAILVCLVLARLLFPNRAVFLGGLSEPEPTIETDSDEIIEEIGKLVKTVELLERQTTGMGLFSGSAFAFSEYRLSRTGNNITSDSVDYPTTPVYSESVFEHNDPTAAEREGLFTLSDFDFSTEELLV
eukprot:PhF_6_TR32722/c0_g1_i3/m.48285